MVMFQKTSALNFVENFRKYSKYIVNEPAAVKERIAVWGEKVSLCQKCLILLITWRNHTVFYVMLLLKEKGKKSFLFRRVFVWYLTQCQSQVKFYMISSMLYVLVLCPLLQSKRATE